MSSLAARFQKELRALSSPAAEASERRFFKHPIKSRGVPTPLVRRLARRYFKEVGKGDKAQVWSACEELLLSGYNQDATAAIQWASTMAELWEIGDFSVFEHWLESYLDNWAKVDDFCLHIANPMLRRYPRLGVSIRRWANSRNLWMRRAAAVSLIAATGEGYATRHSIKEILAMADVLVEDPEDMVQKGYGWMLKAASKVYPDEVFNYVMSRRARMPRVALRYAIEKLPPDRRRQALDKA